MCSLPSHKRPIHSSYTILEECPIDDDDDEPNMMYATKTRCTSSSGYYAVYSNMNWNSFSREMMVYHESKEDPLWTVTDYDWNSPYFINHRGQCYLIVTDRTDIVFRDMTGAIVAKCSTKYGPGCHNHIMTINHIMEDKDAGVQWDCFILEVYCYGYGSTPDVGKQGQVVRGIVTLDQAYPAEGPPGHIVLTSHQYDRDRKCFHDISNTYYLNDETIASLQSDCANWDYITMWHQLCSNMWHRNTKSPLRLLLEGHLDAVDVTQASKMELRGAPSAIYKIDKVDQRDCFYTRDVYNLMLDIDIEDSLLKRLNLLMFIGGDRNPAAGTHECLHQSDIVQCSFIVQFDNAEVILNFGCRLTAADKIVEDDWYEDDKDWYVYDSRVCRITVKIEMREPGN